jgi:hypothetical protein
MLDIFVSLGKHNVIWSSYAYTGLLVAYCITGFALGARLLKQQSKVKRTKILVKKGFRAKVITAMKEGTLIPWISRKIRKTKPPKSEYKTVHTKVKGHRIFVAFLIFVAAITITLISFYSVTLVFFGNTNEKYWGVFGWDVLFSLSALLTGLITGLSAYQIKTRNLASKYLPK